MQSQRNSSGQLKFHHGCAPLPNKVCSTLAVLVLGLSSSCCCCRAWYRTTNSLGGRFGLGGGEPGYISRENRHANHSEHSRGNLHLMYKQEAQNCIICSAASFTIKHIWTCCTCASRLQWRELGNSLNGVSECLSTWTATGSLRSKQNTVKYHKWVLWTTKVRS